MLEVMAVSAANKADSFRQWAVPKAFQCLKGLDSGINEKYWMFVCGLDSFYAPQSQVKL